MSEVKAEYGHEIRAAKELYDSLSFIHSSLDDAGLHIDAFRVYCHILRRAGNDYTAWPSYQTIGDHCFGHLDKAESRRSKAIRAMNTLVERHFLVKSMMPSKGNHYYIKPPSTWMGGDVISPQGSSHITPASDVISPKGTPIEGTPIKEEENLGDPMKRMPRERKEHATAVSYIAEAKKIGLTPAQYLDIVKQVLKECALTVLVNNSDDTNATRQHDAAKEAGLFLAKVGYGHSSDIHELALECREWLAWRNDSTPSPNDLKVFASRKGEKREETKVEYKFSEGDM